MICELCQREVEDYTVHHLIPKSKQAGSKEVALLCKPCHRMIHTLFSNKQLARELHTISSLKKHPEMNRFISWVKKQDPQKRIKIQRRVE